MSDPQPIGSIGWLDITVGDADTLRDFYVAVAGWTVDALDMGGYADYVMKRADTGAGVAGVCHARGPNADLPPQWIPYIVIADLDASVAEATRRGGTIVTGPRGAGGSARFCVVRDPAGGVVALYQG